MELIQQNYVLIGKALAALLVLGLMANTIWHGTKPHLQVGFNDLLAKHERHGSFWVKTNDGGHAQKPFTVDETDKLGCPSGRVLRAMINQAQSLGLVADHLEIVVNGKTLVYRIDGPAPRLLYAA